jgi:hypothetical protein
VGGYIETRLGGVLGNDGNSNNYNIGTSQTNNAYGTKVVALDGGIRNGGSGNNFNIGLLI